MKGSERASRERDNERERGQERQTGQHLDSCTRGVTYPCLSKEDISVSLVRPSGFRAGHLDVITATPLSLAKKACLKYSVCWSQGFGSPGPNWSALDRQLDSSKITKSSALNRETGRIDRKVRIAPHPIANVKFKRCSV